MILAALYDLARREGLLDDTAYDTQPVDFALWLAPGGRLRALVSLQDEKGRGRALAIPRLPKRAVAIAPGFLVDNAKYVLGLSQPANDRDARCLESFVAEVEKAVAVTGDSGIQAIAGFYQHFAEQEAILFQTRPREAWTGNERLCFLGGEEADLIHLRPTVRDYWATIRAQTGGDAEMQPCLVTGRMASPARLHPNIKGVPNAQSTGAALVSFNQASFTSHGLSQGGNAPVSQAVAEGYGIALNWLLDRSPKRRHRFGVRLGSDQVMVLWTRDEAPELETLLDLWESASPDQESALKMADSPLRGLAPSEFDESPFYGLTLGGNAARVVVYDWLTSTLGGVKRNVRAYFDDLRLGAGESYPTPIKRLIDSLRPPGREGSVAPDLTSRLFACALQGRPFPRQLLTLALRRLRLVDKDQPNRYLRERTSLIKAYLNRQSLNGSPERRISVALDDTNLQVPYLLGRLFAVLERLQGLAQGDLNASLRDRYFGSASSTPALVFPRLLKLSVHHAAKAERSQWLEKLKGQIIGALPGEQLPKVMTLEDQGLFAIGYYHQREAFFTKNGERMSSSDITALSV